MTEICAKHKIKIYQCLVCDECNDEAILSYEYLARLFKHVAPQGTPIPTLTGLVTQIDNHIAGLHMKINQLQDDLEDGT